MLIDSGALCVDTSSLRLAATKVRGSATQAVEALVILRAMQELWQAGQFLAFPPTVVGFAGSPAMQKLQALLDHSYTLCARIDSEVVTQLRKLGMDLEFVADVYEATEASTCASFDASLLTAFARWVQRKGHARFSTRQFGKQNAVMFSAKVYDLTVAKPNVVRTWELLLATATIKDLKHGEMDLRKLKVRSAAMLQLAFALDRHRWPRPPLARQVGQVETAAMDALTCNESVGQALAGARPNLLVGRSAKPTADGVPGGDNNLTDKANDWVPSAATVARSAGVMTVVNRSKLRRQGFKVERSHVLVRPSQGRGPVWEPKPVAIPDVLSGRSGGGEAVQHVEAVDTPRSASELLERVKHVCDQPWDRAAVSTTGRGPVPAAAEFEILRHDTPGRERPSWSVVMRGTQETIPGAANPKNMTANFATVAGAYSDEHVAVQIALADAGAEPADAVEFVGHSQGGLTAAALAADPQVNSRYQVAAVVTAGSPIGNLDIPPSTPLMAFENTADIIPGLEGRFNRTSANHITVYSGSEDIDGFFGPHSLDGYISDAEVAGEQGNSQVESWHEKRARTLGLEGATVTSARRYTITTAR